MPETKYSQHTPVLLGTNFLTRVMEDCSSLHGANFLQRVTHESSWHLAFRCVGLGEKQLAKHNNRIAVLRSVEHKRITIRPNEKVTVCGYLDKPQPYQRTCALLQPHPQVTTDLDLQPSLISYSPQSTGIIDVSFSNLSTHTVTVNFKSILCEVQPVDITMIPDDQSNEVTKALLSQIDLASHQLSSEEDQAAKQLITQEFEHLFPRHDKDIGFYVGVKHRIDLLAASQNHTTLHA